MCAQVFFFERVNVTGMYPLIVTPVQLCQGKTDYLKTPNMKGLCVPQKNRFDEPKQSFQYARALCCMYASKHTGTYKSTTSIHFPFEPLSSMRDI